MYSKEGYRRNSPDKNNPYNIIPSGNISMKNVDHPVLGIDEYGNMKWMMPNEDYQFPGNTVFEVPIKQAGGSRNAQSQTKKPVTQTNDKRDYIAENNVSYQWSDAPINTTPLSIPSAYKTTQGGSDSETAYINPIQEQLRLAKLALETLDSAYEDQLRALYNTTPHQVLYEYDEDYRNRMDYNASQNPYKIQYPKTDLRRGDNIPPNTAWMYPNLTGQTRAAMTTQTNQDLAFDIMGAGMANQYFKSNSTLNTLLQDGLKSMYYKKAPWTWKSDPDNYYRLGKKETILEDVIKTGKISARNDAPAIVARSERFPGVQIKQKTFPESDTYWAKGIPLDQKYGPKNQNYGKYLIEASDDIPFIAAVNQKTKQKGFWNAPDINYNNTHIEGQYVKPRQSYAYDELGEIKPSIGTPLKYNTTDFKLLEPHWFYGYKEYKSKLQQGGTAGMDGMMKARLAIDSHFGNPTAKRMTNYDTRYYEFPDGNKGNVYVSSYDNLVTPQVQDVNGKLMFIDNPWSEENANRSYNQSMKFEREEDARYFGENYKKYTPMMNLYQQGGEMNEEIIMKIREALQQGITPEQLVKELQKQGITEQEAIQLVSAAMPQQEEMQQYQYGTTVRHNYVDNINFDNKFNATALGLNAVSDPRNMTWALPDTGFGSELKAISGLASGLAGSYLGYAKLFSKDKIHVQDPKEKPIVSTPYIPESKDVTKIVKPSSDIPTWDWQTQYPDLTAANMTRKASYTVPNKDNTVNNWYNAPGQNTIGPVEFAKGGMKKYQWAGEYYDNPVNKKTTMGNPLINNIIPSPEIYNFDISSLTPQGNTQQTNQNLEFNNIQKPWVMQYGDNTNPNPPRVYIKDNVPTRMQQQSYQNYFPGATIDEGSIAMDNYINQNIYPTNSVNSSNKTSEQLKKEKKYITSRGDSLGFQVANNALIGFQNFNDVLSARDYEKEYNQMLMRTGNSDQRYNAINPTNPYGMYTPNAGIGPNYGLVANSHIQDFGTSMASAKCGGMKKKYKEGGEYNLTQEEIDYILKNGGEIEILD